MNKEKLKFLPSNIFWKIPTFMFPFTLLTSDVVKMDTYVSAGIALCIYVIDVVHTTDIDYLSERIKKLEDSQK